MSKILQAHIVDIVKLAIVCDDFFRIIPIFIYFVCFYVFISHPQSRTPVLVEHKKYENISSLLSTKELFMHTARYYYSRTNTKVTRH